MTRAKFTCNAVEKVKNWNVDDINKFLYNARFNPVTGGSEENKKFFKSTPSGEIKVSSVGDFFEPGKAYYIDFTEVE